MKSTLTQADLREIFSFDATTGTLTWAAPRKRVKVGAAAGAIDAEGYVRVRVNGVKYAAHRLVWLYVNGELPSGVIDHINGIRHDNRPENLRLVSVAENAQNQKRARTDNLSSGLLGAYFNKRLGKWQAAITHDGKMLHLGYYQTKEEAHAAYIEEKRRIHPASTL